jgi:hypothetical protein
VEVEDTVQHLGQKDRTQNSVADQDFIMVAVHGNDVLYLFPLVSGYRSRGLGSVPGVIKFSEK